MTLRNTHQLVRFLVKLDVKLLKMNFSRLFSKDFVYVPLYLFLVFDIYKKLIFAKFRHSGQQSILNNACNIKLKFLKNLGLNSFDCVKKSNLKCFLKFWCNQRFREYGK